MMSRRGAQDTQSQHQDLSSKAVCRLGGNWWTIPATAIIVGGLAVAGVSLSDRNSEFLSILWSALGISGVCLLFSVLHWCRSRVTADADGLRWRTLGSSGYAKWSDVTDFHDSPNPQGWMSIETESGRLRVWRSFWDGVYRLRLMVAERAHGARVSYWGVKGSRPEIDWPCTFTSGRKRTDWAAMGLAVAVLSLPLLLVIRIYWKLVPALMSTQIGSEHLPGIAVLTGFLLLLAAPPLLALRVLVLLYRYRNQRITLNHSGLLFEDGQTRISVEWNQVISLSFVGRQLGYKVVTTSGSFVLNRFMRGIDVVRAVICRAAHDHSELWHRELERDIIGGEDSRWSGGHTGIGNRVFHYRTISNRRAVILLGLVMLIEAASGLLKNRQSDLWFAGLLVAIVAAVIAVRMLILRKRRVTISETGITWRSLQGEKIVAWHDVVEYYWLRSGRSYTIVVVGREITLTIPGGIIDREELEQQIAQRATASATRDWQVREREFFSGRPVTRA